MDWITGLQNAIDYIESHLTDDLDYTEIARQAYSPIFISRGCSGFLEQQLQVSALITQTKVTLTMPSGPHMKVFPINRYQPSGGMCIEVYPGDNVNSNDYTCEIWFSVAAV